MRYVLMLLLTLAVAGAMALTLAGFFRRLRKIESERWGAPPGKE